MVPESRRVPVASKFYPPETSLSSRAGQKWEFPETDTYKRVFSHWWPISQASSLNERQKASIAHWRTHRALKVCPKLMSSGSHERAGEFLQTKRQIPPSPRETPLLLVFKTTRALSQQSLCVISRTYLIAPASPGELLKVVQICSGKGVLDSWRVCEFDSGKSSGHLMRTSSSNQASADVVKLSWNKERTI